jgi:signal transduction histidine kinase
LKLRSLLTVPLASGERIVGALTLLDQGVHAGRFDADLRRVIDEFARTAAMALDNARLYTTATRATRARDEVLSVVSHDLRNPIGAIAMCARIMREAPPDDEQERRRMLSAITEATGWMQRLIRDLLDVTSIDAGHLALERQPASLCSIVGTATSLLRGAVEERSIELEVDVPDDLPTLMVDDGRIVQVVANLLGNAVKFSEPGGRVTISVVPAPDSVVVAVGDAGIGIAPDVQARIFDRFWQAKATPGRGNGLGLAIAHGIVQAHGGRIWVQSTPGQGSTFYFSLPLEEAMASSSG